MPCWAREPRLRQPMPLCRLLLPGLTVALLLSATAAYCSAAEPPATVSRRPAQEATERSPATMAVLYPDVGEPYRAVFARILAGMEASHAMPMHVQAVNADQSAADLAVQLQRQKAQVVVALGRQGVRAAAGIDRGTPVIFGGVLSVADPDSPPAPVFTLAPDPALLFDQLRTLRPAVRRIVVVFEPRQNAWLIRLAREAAHAAGLELVAREAPDLKTAMYLYQDYLATADPRRDALWLPQDTVTVDDATVLPLVLQEAWRRSILVFSSSLAHVRRGVLFALYPNPDGLGRTIAGAARASASGNPPPRTLLPLRDVLTAVNLRTANHLGLGLDDQRQAFDLIFPES